MSRGDADMWRPDPPGDGAGAEGALSEMSAHVAMSPPMVLLLVSTDRDFIVGDDSLLYRDRS